MRNVVETVPEAENREAPTWPCVFPTIAAQVRVPVRVTLAEHEPWWVTGEDELRMIAAAFSAAPVVETAVQPAAGHNISLGWAARSYHLSVLAFAERCLLRMGRQVMVEYEMPLEKPSSRSSPRLANRD
jgi:hypothetical protein